MLRSLDDFRFMGRNYGKKRNPHLSFESSRIQVAEKSAYKGAASFETGHTKRCAHVIKGYCHVFSLVCSGLYSPALRKP
jgi:hypothetical protein